MKQYVVFENDGVIDVRSIKTFGVSVKDSTNPIGYFGTGLKYAIAILLRHGQTVGIDADGVFYEFALKPMVIRGKAFEVVTMNGEELPFTTELGKNWEMWQAFREVYCNCIDESGTIQLTDSLDLPSLKDSKGKTRVIISGAESVFTYHDRDNIVLRVSGSLRIADGSVEVFKKPSKYLYYRGVRVMPLKQPSILTYNIIVETELTEDRTIKVPGMAINKVMSSIARLTDKDIIREILTTRDRFESNLEYYSIPFWCDDPSEEFDDVVGREFELNNDRLNKSAALYWKDKKNKGSLKSYEPIQMNEIEIKQLSKCISICEKTFREFKGIDILIVKTLGDATFAIAEVQQLRMVISRRAFEMGTKFLLSTIIEEYFHIRSGYGDCTREFQNYLFDRMSTIIEDHVIKEPV